MSVLSFKAYCIENYAEYKNLPSSKVFKDFEKTKLLNHLEDDYEDLHGMGKACLMDYFDKWLSGGAEAKKNVRHTSSCKNDFDSPDCRACDEKQECDRKRSAEDNL